MDVTGQPWQSKLHTAAGLVEDRDRRGGGACGGPGLADIKGARGRSHELVAEWQ